MTALEKINSILEEYDKLKIPESVNVPVPLWVLKEIIGNKMELEHNADNHGRDWFEPVNETP